MLLSEKCPEAHNISLFRFHYFQFCYFHPEGTQLVNCRIESGILPIMGNHGYHRFKEYTTVDDCSTCVYFKTARWIFFICAQSSSSFTASLSYFFSILIFLTKIQRTKLILINIILFLDELLSLQSTQVVQI